MAKKKRKKTKEKKINPYFTTKRKLLYISLALFLILFIFRNNIKDEIYFFQHKLGYNAHPQRVFIPSKYDVVGIDISRYQENYNWARNRLLNQYGDTIEVSFVIAKATEGTRLVDPKFEYNKREAAKYPEVIFGAYHFFLPDKDVETQANHFVNIIQLSNNQLLPVVDIEQKRGVSNEKIRERLKHFCNLLENKYGKKPIIYSNKHFMINTLGEGFSDYPLWFAHYEEEKLEVPFGWDWEFWQMTDEGHTFGTQHTVDINVYNGSRWSLKKLLVELD